MTEKDEIKEIAQKLLAAVCRQSKRIIELEGMEFEAVLAGNERWLTLAHVLCSDLGIPQGHIEDRLNAAIDKGAKVNP